MRKLKMATVLKQIQEGRIECWTDLKKGYVEIITLKKKHEIVEII